MPLTAEQVAQRINYLGGTDAPAALGLSRWRTPIQVWAEKAGILVPEDISDKLPVKLGSRMEDIVVELFEEETGKKARRVNETRFHPKYPFLGANIDRRIVGEDAILEVKTAAVWKAKEWDGEEIPHEYLMQVYHYLAVTGAKYAYIGVLIGNQSFVWKKIERDEQLIEDITAKLVDFWNNYVVPKIMPQVVKAGDSDVLYRIFPQPVPGSTVRLGDEADRLVESRAALLADKASISKQIDQVDAEIKALLGDCETGETVKYRIDWKPFKRASYVVKASEGRRLSIKEAKSGDI